MSQFFPKIGHFYWNQVPAVPEMLLHFWCPAHKWWVYQRTNALKLTEIV